MLNATDIREHQSNIAAKQVTLARANDGEWLVDAIKQHIAEPHHALALGAALVDLQHDNDPRALIEFVRDASFERARLDAEKRKDDE